MAIKSIVNSSLKSVRIVKAKVNEIFMILVKETCDPPAVHMRTREQQLD